VPRCPVRERTPDERINAGPEMGVDAGRGGAYKRGPFGGRWVVGGLLFEIVEKREGMRGRRLTRRKAGGGRQRFAH